MAKKKRKKLVRPMTKNALTPAQQIFCIEYCFNGYNGTRAAITAGYSANSADVCASRLLRVDKVITEIKRLKENFEELMERKGITKAAIVEKHWNLASSSIAHLHNTWIERKEFESLTDLQKDCISEISTKVLKKNIGTRDEPEIVDVEYIQIKLFSKQESLKEISKILGHYAPVKTDVKVENDPIIKVINNGEELKPKE